MAANPSITTFLIISSQSLDFPGPGWISVPKNPKHFFHLRKEPREAPAPEPVSDDTVDPAEPISDVPTSNDAAEPISGVPISDDAVDPAEPVSGVPISDDDVDPAEPIAGVPIFDDAAELISGVQTKVRRRGGCCLVRCCLMLRFDGHPWGEIHGFLVISCL